MAWSRRKALVKEAAAQLGFPGGKRLYPLLKVRYYWAGMLRDCVQWCTVAPPNQVEQLKFKPPKHLHPTSKNRQPFHSWSIDLIVNLTPPGPNGEVHAVVAVDAMTKWPEIGALRDKSAATVAGWFHQNITCRYGPPAQVRCDQGTEFRGAFATYLRGIGCK